MKQTVDLFFRYLPVRISLAVHSLPENIFEHISEIRLRKNAPISVTVNRKNITFTEKGRICSAESAMCASENEINECVTRLTEGSRYKYDEYIAHGFIPLPEGGRAGVCGVANPSGGFSEISSVNLRVFRFFPNVAMPLIEHYRKNGVCGALICSPPALGKTTFLRSAAYLLSLGKHIEPKRIGIADERCEIAVGLPNRGLIDVISLMPKADAMNILTRTMAPEIIICDEIGANEVDAVLEAQNTGVTLIASAHCGDIGGLLKRGRIKRLLESGVFEICVMLGYSDGYTARMIGTEEMA